MRSFIHQRARPGARAPTPAGPVRAAAARQAARPPPLHDISRVPIGDVVQRKATPGSDGHGYRAPNRTGLPDRLKAGVEALSGLSMDRVRVHYNSDKPAQLDALAYAQGTDIHVAPGQQRHLPHEAWHVVQQAQGRVRPTGRLTSGVEVNDDAGLEAEADRVQSKSGVADSRRPAAGGQVAPAAPASPGVVQRIVDVDGEVYKAYDKTGRTPKHLVREIKERAAAASVTLKMGWQTTVKDEAIDRVNTTKYTDWDEIIDKFKSSSAGAKRKLKLEEQDKVITGLLKGVKEPVKKRARTIAYESEKAQASVRKHMRTTDEYKDVRKELEALPAANIGAANEVARTTNPGFVFEALEGASMKRLDFNFHDTPIATHGYESMKDRTVDASTLNPFGFGPIKIGDDIGSYKQALKKGKDVRGPSNRVLTSLEMYRVPKTSAMLGLKRDLYEQNKIDLAEAMAIDSPKSNVEFLGAVSGSGLTVDQNQRMQEQQTISNEMILDDYATRFPTFEIGTKTRDNKP
ncbi:MAG TPA: DUF4157 domain-containing protein, partial [Bradyrhizobium sp.]|nr:DUF4157 domain-containing protein [Bradyrhizobium sp.]